MNWDLIGSVGAVLSAVVVISTLVLLARRIRRGNTLAQRRALLEVLLGGVEDWNKWRHEHPEDRPDLIEADLRGADLAKADLHWANLSQADLRGANLHGVDLHGTNLRRADLSQADLSQADLRSADLIQANLEGANLREADLTYACLREADLDRADLRGANLKGAELFRANLEGADLSAADLRDTSFHWADLANADLLGAKWEKREIPADADVDVEQLHRNNVIFVKEISKVNIWGIKNPPDGFKEWALKNAAVEAEPATGDWEQWRAIDDLTCEELKTLATEIREVLSSLEHVASVQDPDERRRLYQHLSPLPTAACQRVEPYLWVTVPEVMESLEDLSFKFPESAYKVQEERVLEWIEDEARLRGCPD